MNRLKRRALLVLLMSLAAFAKDEPSRVMVWPESGKPVLRFSFGKFKETRTTGDRHFYSSETTAENLWDKKISLATFSLYVFDKDKVRIGEAWLSVSNISPGELVKLQTSFEAAGTPATMTLVPQSLPKELQPAAPPREISITVNSVPQGASLKIDGADTGTTPKAVRVTPGKHILEFSKQGFTTGSFPLDIGPDDASGGSVSYELGTSAHDTVELRDGSVLVCDVESVSATEVVVRIGSKLQRINRNQVKRILLVERDMPAR
jgi:PEGA domain-containing protein